MLRPLLIALLALLLVPAAARAASDQVMTFEAPGELLDDSRRDATLDEIQSFGVGRVRALVYWRDFAPNRRSKQVPRFDTADHAAYPAGTWDRLDRLVASIQARGMELQLTLTGPVPTWATKRKRGKVADPSAKLYGRWVRAVAARYGDRVNLWSIWNEPNHPDFLGPQYHGTAPHTPKLYRKLYVAAENAIHGTAGQREGQGAVRRDRADRQRERRLAARVPARRAVPELRTTRSARAARSCGSTATRTTPTRARPARRSSRRTRTRSASARSAGSPRRSTRPPGRARSPRAATST